MYIFELMVNALKKKKRIQSDDFSSQISDGENEPCEHLFMPLDSSNEYFACKYCGLVVPKEKLKNKNIFQTKGYNNMVDFTNLKDK